MFVKTILRSGKEVIGINKIAESLPFDITISAGESKAFILDAKSFLGMFSLIGKEITITAPDHVSAEEFHEAIKRMPIKVNS